MGHKCGHFVAKQVACNSYFVKTNTWTTDFVAQGMQTQKVWDVIRPTSMFFIVSTKASQNHATLVPTCCSDKHPQTTRDD